jgi:predicted ATPase
VGKTRLALRVATVHADQFAGGIRLADLAPVGPALVGDALARALGVVPETGWSLREVLREVAAGMAGLLVVDNCEHVVAEVADIVADLLGVGGELRILATSREPIGVPGEVSFTVHPLEVPPPPAAAETDNVATYDAVRLFIDRAATASPGFTLTDATAPAVAALCRRLDGLPLAIELAASRMRTFGPVELVEHLGQRFELLSAGARTAPARQRTLRGAIDWSYQLLDDDERTLFDRLGVFPADFDFEAVASVCRADDVGGGAVVGLLPRLVDKSLVAVVGGDTRRYRLLETIRTYAAERLATSGTGPAVRRRHALHYIAFAEHAAERLRTADQRSWLERLATEQPHLRAALAHSVEVGDLDAAWRAIAALQRFWDIVGQRHEAHEWIQRTLAVGDPPATRVAVTGLIAASVILNPVDGRAAFELAGKAADLAAGLDAHIRAVVSRAVGMSATWIRPELTGPALREALAGLGDDHPWERGLTLQAVAITAGPTEEALQAGRDSVALFRSVGDQMYAANTLFIMAQRSILAGVADDEVHGWLTESQRLAEAAGSEVDTVHAFVGFAQLAWQRGDRDGAAGLMQQWLPTLRRLGDRRCTGRALYILGEHARERGELTRAEALLRAGIEAVAIAGQSFVLVRALGALAAVSAAQRRHHDAAVLLGAAHAVRQPAGAQLWPIQPSEEHLRRSLVEAMGAAAFDSAHHEGARRSLNDTLHLVPDRRKSH